MNSSQIFEKARRAVRDAGTRNAEKIAECLGIRVVFMPDYKDLLGMYTSRWRMRIIFLNDRLDNVWLQMVLAHEIGHDALHRELATVAKYGMQEYQLFNLRNATEYEANAFAAHLLLDNDEVYELAREGYDVVQMANAMNSHINLMLIKLQEMNKLGYDLRVPIEPDGRFLRKIRT